MTLGERIKDCRLKANLTQEQVAESMQITRQAVTKWESGQSAPSTENLFKLAELFGTTVDFLLTQPQEPVPDAVPESSAPESPAPEPAPKEKESIFLPFDTIWRPIQHNICVSILIGLGFYAFFLIYKLFRCEIGFDRGLIYFLFDSDSRYLPYPFSWLLHNNVYPVCAAISMVGALFGKKWFAITAANAFVLGVLVSEPLGLAFDYVNDVGVTVNHSWSFWLLIYLGGIILGILRQIIAGIIKRRKEDQI